MLRPLSHAVCRKPATAAPSLVGLVHYHAYITAANVRISTVCRHAYGRKHAIPTPVVRLSLAPSSKKLNACVMGT
jgi:hypothetical protein